MSINLNKAEDEKHPAQEGEHDSAATQDDVCPYCKDDEDNRTSDCQYCADLDAQENADGTAGLHDCEMCNEYDEKNGVGHGDDCPYCEEYDAEQGHDCNCPNCPKSQSDQTDLAVEDMGAEHPDNCPECKEFSDAVENQPGQTGQEDPNLQGHETAQEVLDLLDQEPGSEPNSSEAAQKIDNTELPQGDQMQGNASVEEDFGDAQKDDISDSEQQFGQGQADGQDSSQDDHACNCPDCPGSAGDQTQVDELGQESGQPEESGQSGADQEEPDMAGVLQSGLDEHADAQQREKVIQMVSQTLQGFKANKASLEATKEQNQGLYNSCIQMLKSMIELCKLLGLEPQMGQPQDQGAPMPPDQGAPPPAAPEQGAPQEGSPDPKAVG